MRRPFTRAATATERGPGGASAGSRSTHPLSCSRELLSIVDRTARLGFLTAEALAAHSGCSVAAARGRLQHGVRLGLLDRSRPLLGRPSLFTATRAGLRAADAQGLEPARVSAAGARHALACVAAAIQLERLYPDRVLSGVPELRRRERLAGRPLASAPMPCVGAGPALIHSPDLVLWDACDTQEPPIAVEVELTVKAPLRLAKICRAWARCTTVAGVLYVVAPPVRAALERAIADARCQERIVLLEIDRLASLEVGVNV
jgi:hypothetical protein